MLLSSNHWGRLKMLEGVCVLLSSNHWGKLKEKVILRIKWFARQKQDGANCWRCAFAHAPSQKFGKVLIRSAQNLERFDERPIRERLHVDMLRLCIGIRACCWHVADRNRLCFIMRVGVLALHKICRNLLNHANHTNSWRKSGSTYSS